jgi:hypothetical protein
MKSQAEKEITDSEVFELIEEEACRLNLVPVESDPSLEPEAFQTPQYNWNRPMTLVLTPSH